MQKIRTFIFVAFASVGAIFFVLGGLFLNKKQANKFALLLEELLTTLKELRQEPTTVEDKMFIEDTRLTQDMYAKGTNKDLSIECRICGDNTPRGKYYARTDGTPDSLKPYNFICKDCYNQLPLDEEDWLQSHWLFGEV